MDGFEFLDRPVALQFAGDVVWINGGKSELTTIESEIAVSNRLNAICAFLNAGFIGANDFYGVNLI